MAKALIFGISGQDGHFLAELLRRNSIEVIGVSRTSGVHLGSVADFDFAETLIKAYLPDYIFHLAANSTTRHDALFENHQTISSGTLNILESVRQHCASAKVFLSGSAMQFKNDGLPINESSPFEASSAYSVARIQSVYAGRYFRDAFGLKVYVGYFFNHESSLRSEQHVNQKIAAAAKRIAAGCQEKLELGDIEVKKEFNYAGDIVEAVWMLVNQDRIFEAIVGSGEAYSIRQWAELCFEKVGQKFENCLLLKENFIPEYKILISDPALIRSIGWQPKVSIKQLADMMMEAV